MGGDDSQKLRPWRDADSSPGRRFPAYLELNTLTQQHDPRRPISIRNIRIVRCCPLPGFHNLVAASADAFDIQASQNSQSPHALPSSG